MSADVSLSMRKKEYTLQLGDHTIVAEFSDLTDQANGSVIMRCEDTVVLATACMSRDGKSNPGFFNLTVEYMEKFYAGGEILGSRFMRREGRPSDTAILACRVIDRTLRPLFDKHIKNAVQVVVTVLSVGRFDPVVLGINAASLALATSDIPWKGPVGAVALRRPREGGDVALNYYRPRPELAEPENGSDYVLDMTICGKNGHITMIEGMAYEVDEEETKTVFERALSEIAHIERWYQDILAEEGKEKQEIPDHGFAPELEEFFKTHSRAHIEKLVREGRATKKALHDAEHAFYDALHEQFSDDQHIGITDGAHDLFTRELDRILHEVALVHHGRADGRAMDEVRDLFVQAGGISPVVHGSGIFYRGETHVLSMLTLAGPEEAQIQDGMDVKIKKRFMHHYNFPPYSVGETGRLGGLNRREIGHGALAEKALVPVIPSPEEFPYTIRLVSECMASNGSTSQASICASTIAMMDGGVPMKAPVAGIAVGALVDEDDHDRAEILTDIQGPEDHYGDMDFKIAGTREGITALQLDIKTDGVTLPVLGRALDAGKKARLHILDVIESVIPEPRSSLATSAPQILTVKIDPSQIGMVIGPGGKTVNDIREKTGAEISIEDDGTVYVTGKNGSAEKARDMIALMTKEWSVGEVSEGVVRKILDIGAIVSLSPFTDGLVHISEIASKRVENVSDELSEGQTVRVKIVGIDKERGRMSLSIKQV